MKRFVLCLAITMVIGCVGPGAPGTPIEIEIRMASTTPSPGFTLMSFGRKGAKIYISQEIALTRDDIRSAQVIEALTGPAVGVEFTREGAMKLEAITTENPKEPLAIFIDGKLVSAPMIMEPIRGGTALIDGAFSEAEAQRIVAGLPGP